jgi:hypothetical protein
MGARRQTPLPGIFRRILAAGSAALIFALGLFAASPVLHDQLHHVTAATPDDGCAIVLFGNGVSVPVALSAPPPVAVDWCEPRPDGSTEILFDSPRYLLQPERGPPAA